MHRTYMYKSRHKFRQEVTYARGFQRGSLIPGEWGTYNLPDNLRSLFRAVCQYFHSACAGSFRRLLPRRTPTQRPRWIHLQAPPTLTSYNFWLAYAFIIPTMPSQSVRDPSTRAATKKIGMRINVDPARLLYVILKTDVVSSFARSEALWRYSSLYRAR